MKTEAERRAAARARAPKKIYPCRYHSEYCKGDVTRYSKTEAYCEYHDVRA